MDRLQLTRDQLASFLKDFRSIKQFEKLFDLSNFTQEELEALFNQAASSQATANEALAQLSRIADALEFLVNAPRPQEPEDVDPPGASRVDMEVNEVADIDVVTPKNRETMVYDAATAMWRNDSLDLDDLGDVEIATPADREYLIYDDTDDLWKNQEPTLGDMDNVAVNAPADGHVLIYDAGQSRFENALLAYGGNIQIAVGPGTVTISDHSLAVFTTVHATFYETSDFLHRNVGSMTDGTGASAGTLNNAPVAGDPTKWLAVDDGGTLRWVPAW